MFLFDGHRGLGLRPIATLLCFAFIQQTIHNVGPMPEPCIIYYGMSDVTLKLRTIPQQLCRPDHQ